MNLVSIDTERGELRFYISIEGNKPKPVYRIDIPNYRRDMVWDQDMIEAFRLNPIGFIADRMPQDAA